jgi:hypothetical protein
MMAYAIPAAYTTGNGNRNEPDLRGPMYGNWDMSLNRKQKFGEKAVFELRFEAFNVFNNRNPGHSGWIDHIRHIRQNHQQQSTT